MTKFIGSSEFWKFWKFWEVGYEFNCSLVSIGGDGGESIGGDGDDLDEFVGEHTDSGMVIWSTHFFVLACFNNATSANKLIGFEW